METETKETNNAETNSNSSTESNTEMIIGIGLMAFSLMGVAYSHCEFKREQEYCEVAQRKSEERCIVFEQRLKDIRNNPIPPIFSSR